jgi:hypothetical protein
MLLRVAFSHCALQTASRGKEVNPMLDQLSESVLFSFYLDIATLPFMKFLKLFICSSTP